MHWRSYLRVKTQDPPFLWRMVFGVLLTGAAVAYVVQGRGFLDSASTTTERILLKLVRGDDVSELWSKLLRDEENFERLLASIAAMHRVANQANQTPSQPRMSTSNVKKLELVDLQTGLANAEMDPQRKKIAQLLWDSCEGSRIEFELQALARTSPQTRFANHALGEFWRYQRRLGLATSAFEREGRIPEAEGSRKLVIDLYRAKRDNASLRRLAENPLYASAISASTRMSMKAVDRDWLGVIGLLPRAEWERTSLAPALLAAFAGFWWFTFLLHAGQVGGLRGTRWYLCAAAIPLGFLSILATDFLILWQEQVWGIRSSDELLEGLKFFIMGVGLREEFAKTLMVLPLAPFLAARGRALESLVVCAAVGLGFAIIENQQYFARTLGSAAVGRFVTASFFHMAGTGLIGLAIVRGIRDPKNRGPEVLGWFALVVFAHGFYDAFLSLSALVEYSIVASIVLVLLAYQFFHELRESRLNQAETVSLTATFLFSISIVTAATLIYMSSSLGFGPALVMLSPDVLAAAVMVYVFLREMPNTLVTV